LSESRSVKVKLHELSATRGPFLAGSSTVKDPVPLPGRPLPFVDAVNATLHCAVAADTGAPSPAASARARVLIREKDIGKPLWMNL
jgi:hypothetical protein